MFLFLTYITFTLTKNAIEYLLKREHLLVVVLNAGSAERRYMHKDAHCRCRPNNNTDVTLEIWHRQVTASTVYCRNIILAGEFPYVIFSC